MSLLLEQRVVFVNLLHNRIDDHDDREAEYWLVERSRRCHTDIRICDQGTEYIGINNVCRVKQLAIVADDLVEHLEIAAQDSSHLQQNHRHKRRSDRG